MQTPAATAPARAVPARDRQRGAAAVGAHGSAPGAGFPLPDATRRFFEARFGHDFATVRIHADRPASASAVAVDADAFTTGEHIVFRASQFDPSSDAGKRLIAHELAHVVQQRAGDTAIRRQVRHATPPEQAGYVQDAIGFLEGAATHYRLGATVDGSGLIRQLDGWMTMLQHAITQIGAGHTGDAGTVATRLRTAYRAAVTALMTAASAQLGQGVEALHETHRHRIHVWAWSHQITLASRDLDDRAQAIVDLAQNQRVPIDERAVQTVRAIIRTYHAGQANLVRDVVYERDEDGLGVTTAPSRDARGVIAVGSYFVQHTTRAGLSRRVLQVAHELEHVRQHRRGQGGGRRSGLREFLAFLREALEPERTGTGRVSHATRIDLIDQALGLYHQFGADLRATYESDRYRLLEARRHHAARSGRHHPQPPGP